MSRIHDLAVRSIGKLAGATSDELDDIANAQNPNRAQRRAYIKHALPRPLRRAFGFGQWRRHRYLTRK